MPVSTTEDHFAFISQLIAEKDRLVTEKDELMASKDRLWREMYAMLQEKDQTIREKNQQIDSISLRPASMTQRSNDGLELRECQDEIYQLRRRNLELEQALQEALVETDEGDGDTAMDEDGDGSAVDNEHFDRTSPPEDSRWQSNYTSTIRASPHEGTKNTVHPSTPASVDTVPDEAGWMTVQSLRGISIKITPVIESISDTSHSLGDLKLLAPTLLDLLVRSIETECSTSRSVAALIANSQRGKPVCVRRLAQSKTTFWTNDRPGCYACKTCFNKRLPCLRMTGSHHWILLPLPSITNDPRTAWQDEGFYIYQDEGTSLKYPGTWKKL